MEGGRAAHSQRREGRRRSPGASRRNCPPHPPCSPGGRLQTADLQDCKGTHLCCSVPAQNQTKFRGQRENFPVYLFEEQKILLGHSLANFLHMSLSGRDHGHVQRGLVMVGLDGALSRVRAAPRGEGGRARVPLNELHRTPRKEDVLRTSSCCLGPVWSWVSFL